MTKQKVFQRQFTSCMLCRSRWVAGETPKPMQPTTASPCFLIPGQHPGNQLEGWEQTSSHTCAVNCDKTFNAVTPINHKAQLTGNQALLVTSAHEITSGGLFLFCLLLVYFVWVFLLVFFLTKSLYPDS